MGRVEAEPGLIRDEHGERRCLAAAQRAEGRGGYARPSRRVRLASPSEWCVQVNAPDRHQERAEVGADIRHGDREGAPAPAGTFTMPSLVGVIDSATMSGTGVADAMNPNEPVAGCLLRHGELSERKVVG